MRAIDPVNARKKSIGDDIGDVNGNRFPKMP